MIVKADVICQSADYIILLYAGMGGQTRRFNFYVSFRRRSRGKKRERWNNFLNEVPVKYACAVVLLFGFYKLQKMYRIRV